VKPWAGTIVPHLQKKCQMELAAAAHGERAPKFNPQIFNPQIDRFKP
jgi:hypothetical protein